MRNTVPLCANKDEKTINLLPERMVQQKDASVLTDIEAKYGAIVCKLR